MVIRRQLPRYFLAAAFLLLLFPPACSTRHAPPAPATHELVLLHTNDHHGHPLAFPYNGAGSVAGLPARKTFVDRVRAQNPNVLVLDAGDLNQGRPESNLFDAEPDIIGYNAIGYDAMALGNHEFDFPPAHLAKQRREAKFPFLAANVLRWDGSLLAEPYVIKHYNGFSVAILGLITPDTVNLELPGNIQDLTFADEVAAAKRFVPELKRKADIVIALTHLGIFADDTLGSRRLAREVPGLDLIVDGHSHTRLAQPLYVGGVPIVQAWQWGLVMGEARITIRDRKIVNLQWRAVPMNLPPEPPPAGQPNAQTPTPGRIPEDPALLARLEPYGRKVDELLAEVVGESDRTLTLQATPEADGPLGDLAADAVLWYARDRQPDFAIVNRGAVRTDLPAGPIRRKDIYGMMPFDNFIVVVRMSGRDLQRLFDFVGQCDPDDGAFPLVSDGVTFTVDTAAKRCLDVRIQGRPLDPGAYYTVATSSFLASGGNGYSMFKNALERWDASAFHRDVLIDYIRSMGGTVQVPPAQRVRILRPAIGNLHHEDTKPTKSTKESKSNLLLVNGY
jgi:5'-nucleotidase/UDP-sugar diphosphatase